MRESRDTREANHDRRDQNPPEKELSHVFLLSTPAYVS